MNVYSEGWTAIALSSDLPVGGVLRSVVDGQDIAVWRSRSGVVRAWDNRCPHRGMRLSYGFVRGESLTCIYHGWQYGTDGVCNYIPAHPDLTPPKTLAATAFACSEKDGLIWVAREDADAQPDIDLGGAEPVRSLTIDREMASVIEMLKTASFPITEDWEPGQGTFSWTHRNDGLFMSEGKVGNQSRRLIMALQPLPQNRSALHVLTSPAASSMLKTTISRWLERLRWHAESCSLNTAAEALGVQR